MRLSNSLHLTLEYGTIETCSKYLCRRLSVLKNEKFYEVLDNIQFYIILI